MADWNRIRRVLVPVVLIVLVLATTAGMVWHHHAGDRADQCTLCHLTLAPGVENPVSIALAPAAVDSAGFSECFISRSTCDEKPARAPPA